jgi:signal transduction histidine kinase
MAVHSGFRQETLSRVVLILLVGGVSGFLARAAVDAEDRLARAVEAEAAIRERERLARRIHDSVLQALALIHRRGAEIGGDAAALAELAAEQEVALRELVARQDDGPFDGGVADLSMLLESVAARAAVPVQLSAPATAVMLPAATAGEVAAAVAQALDNVARHAGAGVPAWLLVDDEGEVVTVSVRDEGVGFDPVELKAAEQAGRLGVAKSMRGRIEQLGGTMTIAAAPGRGVEVEFSVPR